MDLNTIYSNKEEDLKKLRANHSGLFHMDPLNILPSDEKGEFTTGDFRFSQTPVLAQIHSLFYRFHNKMAKNLAEINPHWSNDVVFYEARRIVIAVYQHITYFDWLPIVLGANFFHLFNRLNF